MKITTEQGKRHLGWELAILLIAFGWGSTFVLVKRAIAVTPPMTFIAVRFAIAAALVAAVRPESMRRWTRTEKIAGGLAGLALLSHYAFQTFGLQRTTASNAGFITGLYVVLVPVFGALVVRKVPAAATAAGVALATAGLFFLARPSHGTLNTGDLLILVCAAAAAIQLLIVARYATEVRPLVLAQIQLLVVAGGAAVLALGNHPGRGLTSGIAWFAIVLTAVTGSAIPFFVQASAQRFVPPTRAAIIFAMEAPFAALFGVWLDHDHLGALGWLGGGLMLVGAVVAELFAPDVEPV